VLGQTQVEQDKMTANLDALLKGLSPVARDEIVRVLGHSNVCIPTCGVLQAVLRHFGFESYAVATEINACNPVQAQIFEAVGGREKAADATPEQRKDWQERGGWAVGISPTMAAAKVPIKGDGWDGHLILRVDDILLDGSIEQCNNSEKDLILPKLLWTPVDAEWDAGAAYACVTLPNGCEVVYGKLDDDSWQNSPYWKSEIEPYKTKTRRLVDVIVSQLTRIGT
jgi:hypothetical protein